MSHPLSRSRVIIQITAVLGFVILTAGCSRNATVSSTEAGGAKSDRISAVSKIIGRHCALPSALLDANYLEEKTGDGRLGPSDYRWFYALEINPAETASWKKILTELGSSETPPQWFEPSGKNTWWLSKAEFAGLKFYSPKPLTGRVNGWVGINTSAGKIYIFSLTM